MENAMIARSARNPARRFAAASVLALACGLAATPQPDFAQSFQGTGTPVVPGSASIATGVGSTTITIGAPEVVIDWALPTGVPAGAPAVFQPAGTTATFQSAAAAGLADYTVLNRIQPFIPGIGNVARAVQFNGTVQSTLNGVGGGNIWFYNPTGIIAGPTAVFSTGSLVLTTDAIDTTGGLYGPGSTIRFRGAANSAGFVNVNAGARLATVGKGTQYIALVAPRVVQAGTVNADGQIGLVAAEQADISINAGLFDIVVTQGTTDAQGIVHTGTTTGPQSQGIADVQVIQMIAMPKNAALTMLLSGAIGYTAASVPTPDGSAVVLSAGYAPYVPTATQALALGSMTIGPVTVENPLTANATNRIDILPVAGTANFRDLVSFAAGKVLNAVADNRERIQFGSAANLYSGLNETGGVINVEARRTNPLLPGGVIDVGNGLTLETSSFVSAGPAVNGADGRGGSVTMIASGGTINDPFDHLYANAGGFGGLGTASGGKGIGGSIRIEANNGGTINVPYLLMSAQGFGGDSDGLAGDATGGSITVVNSNGFMNFAPTFGYVSATANAIAGSATAAGGSAGNAIGGTVTIVANGGAISTDAPPYILADVNANPTGFGGNAIGKAGNGIGGSITLTVLNGGSFSAPTTTLTAQGNGGRSQSATAGNGTGGTIAIADLGGVFGLGAVSLDAKGSGGNTNSAAGANGNGTGGAITIDITSQQPTWTSLSADARAFAGQPVTVGSTGGLATARADAVRLHVGNNGLLTVGGRASLLADALGAIDSLAGSGTQGGGVTVLADTGGSLSVGGDFTASANAGVNPASFANTVKTTPGVVGGSVDILANNGTIALSKLTATAIAQGSGAAISAGTATGGTARAGAINGGTLSVIVNSGVSATLLDARGLGGRGASAANATGGTATLYAQNGTVNLPGSVSVLARAEAGQFDDLLQGAGFNATGGTASAELRPGGAGTGVIAANDLSVDASGYSAAPVGPGAPNTGNGGVGKGGTATVLVASGSLTSGSSSVRADGVGGNATAPANGGAGTGGTARFDIADGRFGPGAASASATGLGGAGATGGAATGGSAEFRLVDTGVGPGVLRTIPSLTLNANALPGGLGARNGGATILTVQPGAAASALKIAGDFTASATGLTGPAGSGFTGTLSGAPLTIGGNAAISAARDMVLTATAPAILDVTGTLTVTGGKTLTSTGLVRSGGAAQVSSDLGLTMSNLQSGGATGLQAVSGPVTVNNLQSAGAVTVLGQSVNLASPGALTLNGLSATAGNASVTTAGNLAVPNGSASGNLSLASTGGTVGSTGALTAGGNAVVSGINGVTLNALTAGGTSNLQAAGGALAVASLTSSGAVTASGRSVNLVSPGVLIFDGASATAGDLTIQTTGNLAFPTTSTASATGALTLVSTAGTILTNSTISAGGNTIVDGSLGLDLGAVLSGGTTLLRSVNGGMLVRSLLSGGLVTVLGRSVNVASSGVLSFADADATAGDLLIASANDLTVSTADATGQVNLRSFFANLRTTGAVNGSTVALSAGGDVAADGNVTAASVLRVDSRQTFVLNGRAVGSSIFASSADIAIGATGQLGARGVTQTIALSNRSPANPTYVGGAPQVGGYGLSAVEAARLFADSKISVVSPDDEGPPPGDIIVGDLSLTYGPTGNIGAGGELKLTTSQRVAITGAVRLTTSSAADTFSIDPTRIDIVTDAGSIRMLSAVGAPLGTLNLTAGTITVANRATLTAVNAASTIQQINTILDQPASNPSSTGYLQAGQINFAVDSGLFIQNTGTGLGYFDRRGFSAGGVSIATTNAATRISVNGVTLGSAGLVNTGPNTARTMSINGQLAIASGLFDPFSTINGCVIGFDCSFVPGLRPEQSSIDGLLNPEGSNRMGLDTLPLFDIAEKDQEGSPPLIDEPVTGVGNDDLWVGDCAEGEQCQAKP